MDMTGKNSYPVLSILSDPDDPEIHDAQSFEMMQKRTSDASRASNKEERLRRVLRDLNSEADGEEVTLNIDTFCSMMKVAEQEYKSGNQAERSCAGETPGALTGGALTRFTSLTSSKSMKYDIFLSHLQRNGQDAIISMRLYLQKAQPGLRTFIDLEANMRDGLTSALRQAVECCDCFLFFITDGILQSEWCAQELRWAVELRKNIVLVRETDTRHGGIEMKDFFQQVPGDLMHVFKNNIAIPWYRQPQFRDVSVRTILNSAQVEDTYERDLRHLNRCRSKLEELISVNEATTNAFDVIQEQSCSMRLVFWLGGFQRLSNPRLDFAYAVIFNLSFWFCGLLCAMNLIYQSVPYHISGTDLLTAFCHLPGWQGWLAWRKYVRSRECAELLSQIKSRPERYQTMSKCIRVAGRFVLVLQLMMVAVVLAGFSLPYTLGLGEDTGNHIHGVKMFTGAHAFVMWAVIPPVIASIFASYSMFAFVALLHILDLENLEETVADSAIILARFYSKVRDDGSEACSSVQSVPVRASSPKSMSSGNEKVDDLEAKQRQITMESKLFDQVLDVIGFYVHKAQGRMDSTCRALSCLWVHLVLFSTVQVLAISNCAVGSVIGIFYGDYEWWFGFQDFFHLGGGFVLLAAAMGMFCAVTARYQALPTFAHARLVEARCPPTRQVEVVGYLSTRPLGMHIFGGTVYMDCAKAVGFFFLILVIVVNSGITMINTIDVGN